MKIKQGELVFQPVTITLETIKEVTAVHFGLTIAAAKPSIDPENRDTVIDIKNELGAILFTQE